MSYDKDTRCTKCGKQKEFMHECPAPQQAKAEAPPRVWVSEAVPGKEYRHAFDVPTVLCEPYHSEESLRAAEARARAEAIQATIKEVDAWLDLLEIDHRDIIAKGQYKDPQEAGREYRNKCNLLGAVRASINKLAKAAEARAALTPAGRNKEKK